MVRLATLHLGERVSCDARIESKTEKTARAALFTAVQRAIAPNAIVIVDGMNYIKGWRYQLYCAARELKLRVCTVRLVRFDIERRS
jgi:protein KTI12